MTYGLRLLFTTMALLSNTPAIAQIPPMHQEPVPAGSRDTLQQMIQTRTADYETSKDAKNSSVVFKGIFSYNDLAAEPTFTWLPTGMDEYHPRKKSVEYLAENIKDYQLLVFLGTWCSDSKDLVPKLYKVLDRANISYENIMLVGMDRAKTTTTTTAMELVNKYKISLLPTIILIDQNGKEAGRIIEGANRSVEQDLAGIIRSVK